MRGFVFDAGAFIALERRSSLLLGILDEALNGTVEVVLPRTVIAQIWRGNPRQANTGRLISAGRTRGGPVIIDELTAERAKQIGITISATSTRTSSTCTWPWPRPSEAMLSSPLMTLTSPESTPGWSSSTSDPAQSWYRARTTDNHPRAGTAQVAA